MLYPFHPARTCTEHLVRSASNGAAEPGTRPAEAMPRPETPPRQTRSALERFPVIRAAAEVVNDLVARLRHGDRAGTSGFGCLVLRVPNPARRPAAATGGRRPAHRADPLRETARLQPHPQTAHGNGRPQRPRNLEGLLPLLRAVGITHAVATLSGQGNERHVDRVDIYPSSAVFIKVPAHARDGAAAHRAVAQIPATEAVEGVVDGMIDGIRWRNGHRGRLWIDVSSGDTRLEMHGERD